MEKNIIYHTPLDYPDLDPSYSPHLNKDSGESPLIISKGSELALMALPKGTAL